MEEQDTQISILIYGTYFAFYVIIVYLENVNNNLKVDNSDKEFVVLCTSPQNRELIIH